MPIATGTLTSRARRGYGAVVPKKSAKDESRRIRLSRDQDRLFTRAAELLMLDFSNFARVAMNEKVERMRAEGKKL